MILFMVFLTALFIAMVTVPVLMRLADRWNFVDVPNARKVHEQAIPKVGGIGMVLGTLIAVALWLELNPTLQILILGMLILSLFGMLDDRLDLDYRMKFLGQLIAVGIAVGPGGVVIGHFDFATLPDWIAYPLTVVFLVGTTNAINLSDGLDGLAAGLTVLSLACIAYLAGLADGRMVMGVAIAAIGAVIGFLRYNTHPAVVFMGDTGSQFLGFSAGLLAVVVTQEVNTAISATLPLLILGLPVVDTLLVMGERILRGGSPFRPDRRHFHHKLLALGFDQHESVLVIYALQAAFIVLAILLRYESDVLILVVYAAMFAVVGLFYPIALGLRWRLRALTEQGQTPLARIVDALVDRHWLERAAQPLAGGLLVVLLLGGSVFSGPVGHHAAWAGVWLLVVWLLSAGIQRFRRRPLSSVDRFALYGVVILIFYQIGLNDCRHPGMDRASLYLIAALAFAVGVGVRFSRRYYTVTASDILVLFILLTASTLPIFSAVDYARLAMETAVAFYALEYLLRRRPEPAPWLRWTGVLATVVMAGRGLSGL